MSVMLNEYLKKEYGGKVYKLALSAVTTCPNRDGKVSFGGCIFCGEEGSGSFASPVSLNISEQIEMAKAKIKSKTDADKFIAYFQSFTNTYAPKEKLEALFTPIIQREDIVALAIATRPDCLPNDVVDLLSKLNKIKPVIIELGLQTIHENSAKLINRGYTLPVFEDALLRLKAVNLHTVVHLIVGIPGESKEMIFQTAEYIARSEADGIKLHLLHVLKNTELEKMYNSGQFRTLEKQEYIELVANIIERMPKNKVIHRLTGDAPKNLLVAPLWSADKKDVLNSINKYFNENNVIQGKKYNN